MTVLQAADYAHLLHPGEIVLWSGRPEKRFPLARRDIGLVLLTLGLMALVIAPWDGRPWDSFFMGMGTFVLFALLFSPIVLLTTRHRVQREIYLLTDRRVMILVQESAGLALRDVKLLRKVNRMRVIGEGGGCATIYLGTQTRFEHFDWLFVPDGQVVAEKIRKRIPAKEEMHD